MSGFRAQQHGVNGEVDLPEPRVETSIRRTGTFLAIDESLGRENDENSPVLGFANLQERFAVLRPSPRLPLQDITHLFPSTVFNGNVNTCTSGLTDRVRRRHSEIPVPSKKRTSEAVSPVWGRLSRPAFKSARPSTGLRSFR